MAIEQLKVPLPMITPKGKAMCHFVIDYGIEHDLIWVCAIRDDPHRGEIWCYGNASVRFDDNETINRVSKKGQ